MDFFMKLGYNFNPQFTDNKAACLVVSDQIFVMLVTENFFKTFIDKKIVKAKDNTEVLLAISAESKEKVDEIVNNAKNAGGKTGKDPIDFGWMYQWGFEDIDGHIWEYIWMDTNSSEAITSKKELTIMRVFDAPLKKVWRAWSDGKKIIKWWGPKGYKMKSARFEFREGGNFHYYMKPPKGEELWGKMTFREIIPEKKIVFVDSFSDEEGRVLRHPMSTAWPLEIFNTLTFVRSGKKTILVLQGYPINADETEKETFWNSRESIEKGFEGTWQQLDKFLKKS